MRLSTKRSSVRLFTAAAILTSGLAATGTLYAQDTPRQPGTMMNRPSMTEMRGMMGMMRQMHAMMTNCNAMMQGMNQQRDRHHPDTQETAPEKKG